MAAKSLSTVEEKMQIDLAKVNEIVLRYGKNKEDVIAMLLECQDRFRYIPREVLKVISEQTGVPITKLLGVATFYRGFSINPVGKCQFSVCMGTACYVLGAPRLLEAFSRELGIDPGKTTKDGKFSLHTINCPGCCGLAPVITIGDEVLGKVTLAKVPRIIEKYNKMIDKGEWKKGE